MGRKCIVQSCINRRKLKGRRLSTIFRFPDRLLRPILRQLWVEKTVRESESSKNLDHFGVCSEHFLDEDYAFSVHGIAKKALKHGAFPTKNLNLDVEPMTDENDIGITEAPESMLLCENIDDDDGNASLRHAQSSQIIKTLSETESLTVRFESMSQELLDLQESMKVKITQVKRLQRKFNRLEQTLDEKEVEFDSIINRLLTKSQVRMMKGNYKNYIHWEDDDISKCLALYSTSAKAYSFIREIWKYPLPSESTLKRYLQKISIKPGKLIQPVLNLLEMKFHDASEMEKACAIAIDEVGIDDTYVYDPEDDQIYGGKKEAYVLTVRGLFYNWKQVLQYDWEQKMSKTELLQIIEKLYECGLHVYAMVSDMGPKNQGVWSELGVGKVVKGILQNTNFPHPITNKNIWVFPDFPHLIKLLRNHLVDDGIYFEDGSILDQTLIEKLLKNYGNDEYRYTEKLTHKNIFVRGKQRQQVAPAFQLFSNKVSKAIRQFFPSRKTEADFIELMNNFSDLMNTDRGAPHCNPYKAAFGSMPTVAMDLVDALVMTND